MPRSVSARACIRAAAASLLVARIGAAQSLPPLDEYHVRTFGPADGLLAGDVTGLAQAPDGFIYVASGRGLVRFDGYSFRRVELPGARSSFITTMEVDRSGRLLLLSPVGLLGYVEDGQFHLLPETTMPIRHISETDDALWLGGDDICVRLTIAPKLSMTTYGAADGLRGVGCFAVVDLPGDARVLVGRRGLARIERDETRAGGLRFVDFGASSWEFNRIASDSVGLILTGFRNPPAIETMRVRHEPTAEYPDIDVVRTVSLATLRRTVSRGRYSLWHTGVPIDLPANLEGFEPHDRTPYAGGMRTRDGTVWLVVARPGDRPVELVRWRDERMTRIDLRPHLDFTTIPYLLEDHEGSIWVGTDRGLVQLTPRRMFSLTRRHGLAESFVVPVLETRDGAAWIGTWGGGLHRFAGGKLARRYTSRDGLPDDRIRALHEAADGTLWVGTFYGFAALRDGRVVASERLGQPVRAFAETTDGTLWIGAQSGLYRRTAGRLVPHAPGHWIDREIWALHATRTGALWIGSERGLFRLAGDTLQAFDEEDGLRSPFVTSIHEEPEGALWFGTYEHGLHRYRGSRFVAITTGHGLPHDGIWRVMRDDRDGMWMSSDQGLFRVDRAALHAVADALERGAEPATRLSPLVFTEADGLPSREFNRASPGGWRLRDGRFLFNGLHGAVVFDPVRAVESRPPPRTVVHAVMADGITIAADPAGGRRLPRGARQIAFEFAALSFAAPAQNRYRYRLEGYDRDWIDGGTQTRASYTNLPPGRYVFHVQGASGGSAWSTSGAEVDLALAPLPSQTMWFRAAAASAVVLLLIVAYRHRVRRLLELERLRLRIASDLHDDVGSNLSSIALLSEILQQSGAADRRHLDRISRAATETIGALRDIIWVVDPKHDHSRDLLHRMRAVAADMLNGTTYSFDDAALEPRPLDMALMRDVLLIYKEALHNVVRHGRATHVSIEVAGGHGTFRLRVRDDGIGFDERTTAPGNGLVNMRRRARNAGGELLITSQPGCGTEVSFTSRLA